MKLSEGDFRAHVETMIEERNFAQLEMWIDHGLSIYTNKEQLNTVWEQDYIQKIVHQNIGSRHKNNGICCEKGYVLFDS